MIALDEDTRRVKHVISTGALDRANRTVDPGGWRLSRFRDNPVVLADHEYSIERIIGHSVETKIEGGALTAVTEFLPEGLGNVAFRLVQAGAARSWSVGWIGLKTHRIGDVEDCEKCAEILSKNKGIFGVHFTQQELLEYSLVAVPANPEAVMGLATAGLVGKSEADEWISSLTKQVEVAKVDDKPEDKTEVVTAPHLSATAYKELFSISRTFARNAAARRSSEQIRRLS